MPKTTCALIGPTAQDLPFPCDIRNGRFRAMHDWLMMSLKTLHSIGYSVFITDAQPGVGIVWGELVLLLRREYRDDSIELVCMLSHEEEANDWHEYWRERYFDLLGESDHVEYTGVSGKDAKETREGAIAKAADLLICFKPGILEITVQ